MRRLLIILALFLSPASLLADVYTSIGSITFADEPYRHVFVRHESVANFGLKVTLLKTAPSLVHAIYAIVEGPLYPAWYSAHLPDATNASHNAGAGAGANIDYYSFLNDGNYCDWNVPAAANGMSSVMVGMVALSGGGDIQVVRNPAGAATVIATLSTAHTSTDYRMERFSALSESVATGDVVRLRKVAGSGTGRIWGIALYNTGVTATAASQLVMPSGTAITAVGSGVEYAYCIAPSGSTPKFVGSYAHQGGAYGLETSPVESWTKDGIVWTPAVSYSVGIHVLSRTTTAYYDAGNADIAHLTLVQTYQPRQITISHGATATVNLETTPLYAAMWPAVVSTSFFEMETPLNSKTRSVAIRCHPSQATTLGLSNVRTQPRVQTLDATTQDGQTIVVASGTASQIKRIRSFYTPSGEVPEIQFVGSLGSAQIQNVFIIRHATTYDKSYIQTQAGTFVVGITWAIPSGTIWGGTWSLVLQSTPSTWFRPLPAHP
jgi:hypothetical protein